jgi:hypothetical protein
MKKSQKVKQAGAVPGAPIKNSPAMMTVFGNIAERRGAQRALAWKATSVNLAHPVPDNNRKLRVLSVALGQVAEAVELRELSESVASQEELSYALTDLAAHCVAWLELLDGQGKGGS